MTVIAIDFGTSNTVVSILEPDTQTPKTLRFPSLSRVFIATARAVRTYTRVDTSLVFQQCQNLTVTIFVKK